MHTFEHINDAVAEPVVYMIDRYVVGGFYRVHAERGISFLIQGGARGADYFAWEWANERGVMCGSYPADWDAHGKRAGPIRNQQMIDEGKPDGVVAFPGGRGTKDMVDRAEKAGLKVWFPCGRENTVP